MKRVTVYLMLLVGALLAFTGCKSKNVKKFDGLKDKLCKCSDKACAIKVHKEFEEARKELFTQKIDWKSSKGKKEKKALEKSWKGYMKCMHKVNPASAVTKLCQKDKKAMESSKECRRCCTENARRMKYWNSGIAGAAFKALGGSSLKGCACK